MTVDMSIGIVSFILIPNFLQHIQVLICEIHDMEGSGGEKKGPNDLSNIVWANSKCFFSFMFY